MSDSPAMKLARRVAVGGTPTLEEFGSMFEPEEILGLISMWEGWLARPEQHEPEGDWKEWLLLTGRGFGKTRTENEWLYKRVKQGSRAAFMLGRTYEAVRDVMINGPSGCLEVARMHGTPWEWKSSTGHVITHTGSSLKMHTSEKPDALRGPEYDTGAIDEFAALKAMVGVDGLTAFDNARFTLRAIVPGLTPRVIMATTPKRVKAVKTMLADSKNPDKKIVVTRGSLRDNLANLDPSFVADVMLKYGGTSLGEQEIEGILARTVEGAIFTEQMFDKSRITDERDLPELSRPVCTVDPSVGDGTGDECGIIVSALSAGPLTTLMKQGALSVVREVRHLYYLEDASMAGSPDAWADRVIDVCERHDIREVVVEGNQGRELLRPLLKTRNPALRVKLVNARVGKQARAQPAAGLFAQNRAHIVGEMPDAEDQATTWIPERGGQKSPDRVDALAWAPIHFEKQLNMGAVHQTATSTWARKVTTA